MAAADHPMTPAGYRATVAKLHRAYVALAAASETAEYGEAMVIARAMDALARVPDDLRVQVCRQCNRHGYYRRPDDAYASYGCLHPDVPRYSVKTGEVIG